MAENPCDEGSTTEDDSQRTGSYANDSYQNLAEKDLQVFTRPRPNPGAALLNRIRGIVKTIYDHCTGINNIACAGRMINLDCILVLRPAHQKCESCGYIGAITTECPEIQL